jgi:hypothetical protein
MGIFDFVKKKPQKNKYQVHHESISAILKLLERKKKLVEKIENGKSIIDLEFDTLMVERMTLVQLKKSGNISFLGDDLNNVLLEIFNDQEIKKDEIMHICNYLLNEQNKLVKLF